MLCEKMAALALIEILWSNLTLEQNSSWIWLSAGTPMLVLSTLVYSELALEYRQKVKSKNYFVQVSNSTTKFLSVHSTYYTQVVDYLYQYSASMPPPSLLPPNCQHGIAEIPCWVVFRPSFRDIHIESSKQFKWNSYLYVSGQSRPFLGSTKTALKFKYEI